MEAGDLDGYLPPTFTSEVIKIVHAAVFGDTDFAGRWKEPDIFLGTDGRAQVISSRT
ncbi:MAG: hypothetical protein HY678_09085 [Chloroflexi bacterium]|nr:hypothetical protein [Chloroflexota bacterium]